jgi:hypothetical protein
VWFGGGGGGGVGEHNLSLQYLSSPAPLYKNPKLSTVMAPVNLKGNTASARLLSFGAASLLLFRAVTSPGNQPMSTHYANPKELALHMRSALCSKVWR